MIHREGECARSDTRSGEDGGGGGCDGGGAGSLTRLARLDVAQGDEGGGSKRQVAEPALRWARHGAMGRGRG